LRKIDGGARMRESGLWKAGAQTSEGAGAEQINGEEKNEGTVGNPGQITRRQIFCQYL